MSVWVLAVGASKLTIHNLLHYMYTMGTTYMSHVYTAFSFVIQFGKVFFWISMHSSELNCIALHCSRRLRKVGIHEWCETRHEPPNVSPDI